MQYHAPPASIESRPVQEVHTLMAPTRAQEFEESCEKTQSRLLILHKRDEGNEQCGRPPPITTDVLPSPIPRLRQRPRVHFEKRSNVISMQLIPCPTREVFKDPFPLELESLFSEEDSVSAKFSSKDTATVEPINALVEPTEWSMLVEDTRALLGDISEQLNSIGPGSQKTDQGSQAKAFGPVKASVVMNGGISDGGDRDMNCYRLEECIRKGYLYEAECPETRERPCFRPKHHPHNTGGGKTGHIHQVREFDNRIRERVGHTTRTQCMQRPEDPGGISGRRYHGSCLGGGIIF